MADEDNLPPLPTFLDRKTWDKDMWKRSAAAHEAVKEAELREVEAIRARAKEIKMAKEAKAVIDAQKAIEKKATLERREAKRLARNAMLHFIRRAMDKGPVTANELRQAVAPEKKGLVPWALRTMLKTSEIEKVSRQTYKRRVK